MHRIRGWVTGTLICTLISTGAWGAPSTLVLGAGDCHDPDVLDLTTALGQELAKRAPNSTDFNAAFQKLRPQPDREMADIKRALDGAQSLFYDAKYKPALEQALDVVKTLEKVPPSTESWKLMAQSLIFEGLVLRALNEKPDKPDRIDPWKRVLSHEPGFQLDRDLYTPTTLQQFEQVRKELSRMPKLELTVRGAPGAEVQVDGRTMGKVPYKGSLAPQTYQVTVVSGEQRSFAHEVYLGKATELQIDLAFEGAVQARVPICVSTNGKDVIDPAIKLAGLLNAEQVMVVRNESPSGQAGFVSVTAIDVKQGTKLRIGGMKANQVHTASGVSSLADFLVTGKTAPPVVAMDSSGATPPVAPVSPAPPAEKPGEPVPPSATGPGVSAARVVSYIAIGAGVVAVAVGLGVYLSGDDDRNRLSSLLGSDGSLPPSGSADYQTAVKLLNSTQANQNLSIGLWIGGGVAVVGGLLLFFLAPATSEDTPRLQAGLFRDGGWVGLSGHF